MSERRSGLDVLKAALYWSVVCYVLLGALAPYSTEPELGFAAAATRQILIFFCLAALGLVLFPRLGGLTLGLSLVALAGATEALQLIPALGHIADPLDVVSAGGGVLIAGVPVVIGREFPLQPRGSSPTSLSFLP